MSRKFLFATITTCNEVAADATSFVSVGHTERNNSDWIFPAAARCRSKIQSAAVESADRLRGLSLGGNRRTIIELVSHLIRAAARSRAGNPCRRGGQKRVRDSNSVVPSPRIIADGVPFCTPAVDAGCGMQPAKTAVERLTFRAFRGRSSLRGPCNANITDGGRYASSPDLPAPSIAVGPKG